MGKGKSRDFVGCNCEKDGQGNWEQRCEQKNLVISGAYSPAEARTDLGVLTCLVVLCHLLGKHV